MRIIGFYSENFKKLKIVRITPDGDVVTLSGANEQGKTSILDGIWSVLDWKNASRDISEPIRRGQKKALNRIDMEDGLVATRTFTEKGTYLKVENADGAEYKSPQAILDKIVGNLTFDPLAFSNLKENEQLETLLKLVEIPLDLDAWALERKNVFDSRTIVNRKISELDAQYKAIQIPDDTPDEEISAASVLTEQRKAQAIIDKHKAMRRDRNTIDQNLTNLHGDRLEELEEIASLESRLRDARSNLAATDAEIKKQSEKLVALRAQLESLVDPDLSLFESKITEVESVNRLVRAKQRQGTLIRELNAARGQAGKATERLYEMDQQREDALRAARMPIEGLSFDDNGVLYRDIPFKQCSSAERLRVSIAMGMALNPKLRVMFVRDGSLLDTKQRELIAQMAKDNNYQLWMELTDDTGQVGLYIEDGEIPAHKKTIEKKE